jgi:predicted RND superfamily exporter protein
MLRIIFFAFGPYLAQSQGQGCATQGGPPAAGAPSNPKDFKDLWTLDMRKEKEVEAPTDIIVIGVVLVVIGVLMGVASHFKGKSAEHAMESSFESLGRFCGKHPKKLIAFSLFLTFVFSWGASQREEELDPATLWVPKGSTALDHNQYVKDNWPSNQRFNNLLISPKGGTGRNMLSPKFIQAWHAVHEGLMEIKVNGDDLAKFNPDEAKPMLEGIWTFGGHDGTKKKCFKWGNGCATNSISNIFGFDSERIAALTDADVVSALDAWDKTPKYAPVPGLNGETKSFELSGVLGGIKRDDQGRVVHADIIMATYSLIKEQYEAMVTKGGRMRLGDPIADWWEADAICLMGMYDKHPISDEPCEEHATLKFTGLLGRSFTDEFGNAIQGDIAMVGIAYVLIAVYLVVNLGKRDSVHSMIALSFGELLCIGAAVQVGFGMGGFIGIKNNPLTNNIYFLILGLGVDDAFVLVGEFTRWSALKPEASVTERIALTTKTGGLSILITSLTDALAFLVGSGTVLPALSGFCLYCGFAVIGCFLAQIVLFLPILALNAKRAEAQRYDCCCCFTAPQEHKITEPQGCCFCCKCSDGIVRKGLGKFGDFTVKNRMGRYFTLFAFAALLASSLGGVAQIKKDFKLEWFFPEDSYVNEFFELNREYFEQGTRFRVYTAGVDFYEKQAQMNTVSSYLRSVDFLEDGPQDWWYDFSDGKTIYSNKADFWKDMLAWYRQSTIWQSSIKWADANCALPVPCDGSPAPSCDPAKGIAHARSGAQMKLEFTQDGAQRFEVLDTLRRDLEQIFGEGSGDKNVFPFQMDFLYWEEMGVIDRELIKNLVICGGIILILICALIPRPRVAFVVAGVIVASIVEVVGISHYWGVTVNGVATIYILICVGLAVDYAAHIAHAFKDSSGTAEERSMKALTRIGPSVFHALTSTVIAIVVIGFSKSYIFKVFFKIIFLVTIIAGSHGLWLLPALLSIIGGENHQSDGSEAVDAEKPAEKQMVGNGVKVDPQVLGA